MRDIHILCGGISSEHEISLRSAQSIINYIDKDKYRVSMSYIDKEGKFIPIGSYKAPIENPEDLIKKSSDSKLESISKFIKYLDKLDNPIIIPVIHGTSGEDGQIQGFIKTLGFTFVGNDILSSALCMDKGVANDMFRAHNIPQANYYVLTRTKYDRHPSKDKIVTDIFDICGDKVFVKPANNGSSVGVNRANRENIIEALEDAFKYDNTIVIEEEIIGDELEISVVGNENPVASLPGSYSTNREFFDYTAKYHDRTLIRNIPHKLDKAKEKKVRTLAIDAYQATGCSGFARVDIFLDKKGNFYVNEINTFPGMTFSSLSAGLWEATDGTTFTQLVDRLIDLAIDREKEDKKLVKVRD